METFITYALSHPGQTTNVIMMATFGFLVRWLYRYFQEQKENVDLVKDTLKNHTHFLVGVKGDKGLVGKTDENTEDIRVHETRLNQHDKDLVIIRTRIRKAKETK
jgi:hypothetical protein